MEPNQKRLATLMQCYYEVQQVIEHVLYSKKTETVREQRYVCYCNNKILMTKELCYELKCSH